MVRKTAAKKSAGTTKVKAKEAAPVKKTAKKSTSVSAKTVRSGEDAPVEEVAAAPAPEEKKVSTRKRSSKSKSKSVTVSAPTVKKSLKLAPGVLISGVKKNTPPPCSCHKEAAPQTFRKLKKKEIEDIRQKLIDMREVIIEGMRKEYADSRSRSGSAPADIVDQAADAYDDDISSEIAANNDEELEQIEAALERLKEGSYGLCEMCSDPISPSRLKILPFATRCVSCRGDYEKIKKRRNTNINFFGDGEFDPEAE